MRNTIILSLVRRVRRASSRLPWARERKAVASSTSEASRLIGVACSSALDDDTRAAAVEGLGRLRDPSVTPALSSLLRSEGYIAVCAALALGSARDPRAVRPLVDLLRDERRFWVERGAAAVALGRLGEVAAPGLPALIEASTYTSAHGTENWDERAREAVVDAIERIRNPQAPSRLLGRGHRYEMWGLVS